MSDTPTAADLLVRRLKLYGVRHVFGYPGSQLAAVYDALLREADIRHILARDEQAAAFMADGYARATGKPGVCLAVCGPGVFNAATALATSFTDSIPVLLISGQIRSAARGLRSGYYHENDQLSACTTFTKWRGRAENVQAVLPMVDAAFQAMIEGRPGPAFLEIPQDILRADGPAAWPDLPPERTLPMALGGVSVAAEVVGQWQRPIILAGGGVLSGGAESVLLQVAERLGAPVFTSLNGKSAIPADHSLAAGLPWSRATSDVTGMEEYFSPLFRQADGLLAVGCRFTQPTTGTWRLPMPKAIVQFDIDPAEIGRHCPVALGIVADAKFALRQLLLRLPARPRVPWTAMPHHEPWRLPGIDLIGPMRRALPRSAIITADITRLAYVMLAEFPVYLPRTFLHPAGFIAMGYGIPSALGAKVAFPERTVVTVVGDGCFLMSGMELATAVQEKLPIIVVLVNDNCLSLIKATQQRRFQGRFIAVDLQNPDFQKLADSFGVRSWRVDSDPAFEAALGEAVARNEPALIEVRI